MSNDFRPIKVGKFKLLERIASGGMAEVYRATSAGAGGFEKQIALKRILPNYASNDEFRRMFEYEARLSSVLSHANIVQIIDFVEIETGSEQTYYLAMEYVDGKNLRQFVNKARKAQVAIPVEFAAYIVNEVCKGLEYAHSKRDDGGRPLGIIHRDMSPQNVMLSFEGAVKIVDFGIAKAKDKIDETRSGVIKGKFGYMSPEQANGHPIDSRSDIFSTGIILWEMITGKRLFAEENDMATLRKIQECVVLPPARINPKANQDVERVTLKSLTKDLSLRYQNAGEFQRDLQAYLGRYYPKYTQKDAQDLIQRVFREEIAMEKKRWEALRSQPIPYSQGSGSRPTAKEDHGYIDGNDDEPVTASEADGGGRTAETQVSDLHSFADFEPGAAPSEPTRQESVAGTKSKFERREDSLFIENEQGKTGATAVEDENDDDGSYRNPEQNSGARTLPQTVGTQPRTNIGLERERSKSVSQPGKSPNRSGSLAKNPPPRRENTSGSNPQIPLASSLTPGGKSDPSIRVRTNGGIEMAGGTRVAEPIDHSEFDKTQLSPGIALHEDVDERGRVRREPAMMREPKSGRRSGKMLRDIAVIALVLMGGLYAMQYVPNLPGGLSWKADGPTTASNDSPDATARPTRPEREKASIPAASGSAITNPVAAGGDGCVLSIDSDPQGATVLVGTTALTTLTPTVFTGSCNSAVNVTLRLAGHGTISENIYLKNTGQKWQKSLKRLAQGSLEVTMDVGAEIFDGDTKIGEAQANTPTAIPMPPGRRRLRFISPVFGYRGEREVDIVDGKTLKIQVALDPHAKGSKR